MARLVDLVAALLGLLLLAPVLVITALLVRMSSRGPVFVSMSRRRNDGTTVGIYNFRTTHLDSSEETHFGRVLQETSLNELPALINVLFGDLTLKELMAHGRL